MKISILTDSTKNETEIQITCNHISAEINKVIEILSMIDGQLTGVKDDETYMINIVDVLYIETVDKRTFIYTHDGEYESNLKLYEIEEKLEDAKFLRVGKSTIINLQKIKSLRAEVNRRIRVTLENEEQIIVSRKYVNVLKNKLGIEN